MPPRLHLSLDGQWNFWIDPHNSQSISSLDDDSSTSMLVPSPWQGDWASSFGWHRFESLPTDHVVNFAFADLTPEHVIHGFAPRDFALDVFAGLFVGWLQKPIPTVARKRVGRGTLLISTFRLSKNLQTNPLAKYLLCDLLEILA